MLKDPKAPAAKPSDYLPRREGGRDDDAIAMGDGKAFLADLAAAFKVNDTRDKGES